MFRVRDIKGNTWLKDDVWLHPSEDFCITFKKKWYGEKKVYLVFGTAYALNKDIGFRDKNKTLIFEGDICSAKDGEFIGVIAYVPEHASYYLLDDVSSKFYPIGEEYSKLIEVIGNVFDNAELLIGNNEKEE